MSAGFTYGSFGDIITTIQLLSQLTQALSEARGSRHEFQDMVHELRAFQDTLSEAETRLRLVDAFLANTPTMLRSRHLSKYYHARYRRLPESDRNIFGEGSRKGLADAARMIQWHLCEASDVERIRDKIRRTMDIVQLVQTRAQGIVQEQNDNVIAERLSSIEKAESQAVEDVVARFEQLIEKLEADSNRKDEDINAITSTLLSTSTDVVDIRGSVATMSKDLSMLIPTLAGLIPLDIVRSWETLDSIIKDRFLDRPGRELIRSRRYVLQDSLTGLDVCPNIPFYVAARPGRRLNMSMIFRAVWTGEQESVCGKCGNINFTDNADLDIACKNQRCGLIYRGVLDLSDLDEHQIDKVMALGPLAAGDKAKHTIIGHDDDDDEDTTLHLQADISDDWNIADMDREGPEVFKRVRFLSRWEDLPESRGFVFASFGNVHLWTISLHGYAGMIKHQMALSTVVQAGRFFDYIHADQESCVPYHDVRSRLWFKLGFIGRSKMRSVPALVLYSESRKVRSRARRVLKELPWLQGKSRYLLMTGSGPAFGTEKDFQQRFMNIALRKKTRSLFGKSVGTAEE
ncbi:hypothetical protein SCUP234_05022 [Seiridium cupressi]